MAAPFRAGLAEVRTERRTETGGIRTVAFPEDHRNRAARSTLPASLNVAAWNAPSCACCEKRAVAGCGHDGGAVYRGVRLASRDEIDLAGRTWTVPGHDRKTFAPSRAFPCPSISARFGPPPVYQRIAAEAAQMRDRVVRVAVVARHFGVDHHTVDKSLAWYQCQ